MRDFGPSVRELDREGEDAQTRGFGVVGHRDRGVGVEEVSRGRGRTGVVDDAGVGDGGAEAKRTRWRCTAASVALPAAPSAPQIGSG